MCGGGGREHAIDPGSELCLSRENEQEKSAKKVIEYPNFNSSRYTAPFSAAWYLLPSHT